MSQKTVAHVLGVSETDTETLITLE